MQQAAWESQRSQQAAELQERERKLNDERSELAAQRNEIAQSEPARYESQNDLTKLQEALAQQQADFETRERAAAFGVRKTGKRLPQPSGRVRTEGARVYR